MRRALLAALACVLLPRAAAAQDQEARGRLEVTDIEIVGASTFPTDSLRRAIVNRETECRFFRLICAVGLDVTKNRQFFSREEFPRDAIRLRLYYWQRGYREAQVDTASRTPEPGAIELTFTIREGRPVLVDSIRVEGGADIADPGLLGDLPLQEGDPLSGIAVEATRDTLEARLHDAGYAYALVLLRTELPVGSYSARVTFDVDPGPRARFGPIDIVGNQELSDEVVNRMLGFREGDLYGPSRLLDAQRNLFSLELVQYARVDTLPGAELDTIIPLRVEITEGYEYQVRAGVGWSTAECMSGDARWTARNFSGGARRLQVRSRLSNVLAENLQQPFCSDAGTGEYGRLNWLLGADFSQPWIFSPRNALTLGLYGERTSLKDVFVRTAVGVNLALVRSLGRGTPLTLTYRPQLSKLEAAEVFFCTSFLACAPSDIEILQGANWLAPVGVNVTSDRTDNLLNPRAGYRGAFDLEHASGWTGSNYAYNRALTEASAYRGVGSGALGVRLRLGWVGPGRFADLRAGANEVVHPQKRFFAGGSNSVRGYAQNRLGPKVLTIVPERLLPDTLKTSPAVCTLRQVTDLTCDASGLDQGDFNPQPTGGTRSVEGNIEARFPITREAFEGVAFLDFGNVFAEDQPLRLGDVAWTPGVGVRYYSVIGPMRLDIGFRPGGGESLQVVTSRVEPCVDLDDEDDCTPMFKGGSREGFRRVGELALLQPRIPFDDSLEWWQRLQVHFSIGQAF